MCLSLCARHGTEIDLKKMPLGNLKKSQIQSGYEVLTSIQAVLEAEGGDADLRREQQLTDLSNHFYTVIPHDFGLGRMKLINSLDDLRAKVKMIEALLDIEAAVTMLSNTSGGNGSDSDGPKAEVDQHYEKLHCKLKPVEPGTEAYKHMEKYVKEGKAPTGLASYEKFPKMKLTAVSLDYLSSILVYLVYLYTTIWFGDSWYAIAAAQVFEVAREGESDRFEPQKSLGNRRMLWHGSRTSNFGGILSQGMRIAPPEAPKTGYRFVSPALLTAVRTVAVDLCASAAVATLCHLDSALIVRVGKRSLLC